MNKSDAITAMINGAKIRHYYFSPGEWVVMIDEDTVQFEDGVKQLYLEFWALRTSEAWETDWEIVK